MKHLRWLSRQAFLTLLGITAMCLVFWAVRTLMFFFALWRLVGVFGK